MERSGELGKVDAYSTQMQVLPTTDITVTSSTSYISISTREQQSWWRDYENNEKEGRGVEELRKVSWTLGRNRQSPRMEQFTESSFETARNQGRNMNRV